VKLKGKDVCVVEAAKGVAKGDRSPIYIGGPSKSPSGVLEISRSTARTVRAKNNTLCYIQIEIL
jgi:hypothetical protein